MPGASENTIGYALDYMRIYALGTIFVQLTLWRERSSRHRASPPRA